jgi:hypothetical protein
VEGVVGEDGASELWRERTRVLIFYMLCMSHSTEVMIENRDRCQ